MVKIKFTCVAKDNETFEEKIFSTIQDIEEKESLREVCKNIYLKLINNENIVDYTTTMSGKLSVGIKISLKQRDSNKCESSPFRIGEKGQIIFLNYLENIHYDWTITDLSKLKEAEYFNGEIDGIIFEPYGLGYGAGAAGLEYLTLENILRFYAIIGALKDTYNGFVWGKEKISEYKFKRNIQLVAKKWQEEQGMYTVPQLREFIEEYGPWKLENLKKALQINEEYAMMLLYNLGYEPQGDIWVARVSKDGLRRYEAWIEGEKKANLQVIEERTKNL
ncbi:hypothetical protein [Lactococcus garvieae]|uniref:hypothetical protein n=1 Tax=Lactococcus garvieae TaxID=1363 RepID=UPI0023ED670E|nr:hypothetical protein [Lactococcus garvieae]